MTRSPYLRFPFNTPDFMAFEARVRANHPAFERTVPTPEIVSSLLRRPAFSDYLELHLSPSRVRRKQRSYAQVFFECTEQYTPRRLPKRKGGFRTILEPPKALMDFQRDLLQWLVECGPRPSPAAYGFVPKRSHVDHARLHVGKHVVASIDLKDFFSSVTDLHLWHALSGAPLQLSVRELHALICLVSVDVDLLQPATSRGQPWTSEACALIDRHLLHRASATRAMAQAILARPGELVAFSARRLERAAKEWGTTPDKLYIGMARAIEVPSSWSPSARRLSIVLCLVTGQIRTESRRRLIVDLLGALGLEDWVEDRAASKSIRALRDLLTQDLRARKADGRLKYLPGDALSVLRPTTTPPTAMEDELEATDQPRLRVLPQGAPTSPWLANLAAADLDAEASAFAEQHGLTYSRYADDLAFSGDTLPPRFVHRVAEIVQRCGFQVNRDKVVIRHAHQRQVVTGVVVNERPAPAGFSRRTLRVMRHAIKEGRQPFLNKDEPLSERQFQGHMAYWQMVDPTRVKKISPASGEMGGEE